MTNEDFVATRYSTLAQLWAHHNTTQFQWPPIILGAVFVAVSLLVDKVTIDALIKTEEWGQDPAVRFGAGVPLIFIGIGTMVMLYTMARARKIMGRLEKELVEIDRTFRKANHPRGMSGAKLVWRFMALVAAAGLVVGFRFLSGPEIQIISWESPVYALWIALFIYGSI